MARTHHLVDAGTATNGASATIATRRVLDEAGLVYAELSGTHSGLTNVLLQGKVDDNENAWHTVATITYAQITGTANDIFAVEGVKIYPQMRIAWQGLAGAAPVLDCWLTE